MTASHQIGFSWPQAPAMRRSDFVVSACNQAALEWIEIWPQWNSPASILWGPRGCGKTHLAHIWAEKSQAVFLDPNASEQDIMALVLRLKNFVLDDADQFPNRQVLFHILNAVKNQNGSLLLLSDKPAAQWDVPLADLASRLNALPQIAILPPDDEMLSMLMTKLFADRQLAVDAAVIDYAVRHMHRSYAAVRAFVDVTDRFSLEIRRNITLSLARQILPQIEQALESQPV